MIESNTLRWVLLGVLSFVFFMAGGMKLARPRDKVIASGGKWAEDFTDLQVKLIGLIEVIIAAALVGPKFLGFAQGDLIAMSASVGVMVVMAGASFTHFKRKEFPFLGLTGLFILMGAAAAWLHCPSFAS